MLDDYHMVRERGCHDQVAFLLLHLPPAVQLVMITRTDPPLPLARLRAAGELRARELRFGSAQVAELVAGTAGVELSDWLRRSGLADEAISHAQAVGDVAEVVNLIADNWYAYVASGQVATVRGWLSSLGDAAVTGHPVAAHCGAWAAALSGDRESLRRWLPIIEEAEHDGPLPDGLRSLRSSAALLNRHRGNSGGGILPGQPQSVAWRYGISHARTQWLRGIEPVPGHDDVRRGDG